MRFLLSTITLFQLASLATCATLRPKPRELELTKKGIPKADTGKKTLANALNRLKTLRISIGTGNTSSPVQSASFDPAGEDDDWPGAYPSVSILSTEELMLNIREDDFPEEMYVRTRVIFSLVPDEEEAKSATKSFKPSGLTKQQISGGLQEASTRELVSIPIDFFNMTDTLYQIEITDFMGNGICCGDKGNGWITVTDRNQDVLWSAVGNYSYVATAYFYKDTLGTFQMVGSTSPSVDGFVPPGVGGTQAGSTQADTDSPGATDPPTFSPTDAADDTDPPPSSNCQLCPTGSTTTPSKTFPLGDTDITCTDLEDVYAVGLSNSECTEFEDTGISNYYRALCNCPGFEPACPLCGGDPVEDPELVLPGDEDPELTCVDFELFFMTLDSDGCEAWDSDTTDALEDFCGCP